jgi:hypothetical protein
MESSCHIRATWDPEPSVALEAGFAVSTTLQAVAAVY